MNVNEESDVRNLLLRLAKQVAESCEERLVERDSALVSRQSRLAGLVTLPQVPLRVLYQSLCEPPGPWALLPLPHLRNLVIRVQELRAALLDQIQGGRPAGLLR